MEHGFQFFKMFGAELYDLSLWIVWLERNFSYLAMILSNISYNSCRTTGWTKRLELIKVSLIVWSIFLWFSNIFLSIVNVDEIGFMKVPLPWKASLCSRQNAWKRIGNLFTWSSIHICNWFLQVSNHITPLLSIELWLVLFERNEMCFIAFCFIFLFLAWSQVVFEWWDCLWFFIDGFRPIFKHFEATDLFVN